MPRGRVWCICELIASPQKQKGQYLMAPMLVEFRGIG